MRVSERLETYPGRTSTSEESGAAASVGRLRNGMGFSPPPVYDAKTTTSSILKAVTPRTE